MSAYEASAEKVGWALQVQRSSWETLLVLVNVLIHKYRLVQTGVPIWSRSLRPSPLFQLSSRFNSFTKIQPALLPLLSSPFFLWEFLSVLVPSLNLHFGKILT